MVVVIIVRSQCTASSGARRSTGESSSTLVPRHLVVAEVLVTFALTVQVQHVACHFDTLAKLRTAIAICRIVMHMNLE